ncbi:MAG: 16S rRNA (cytosine(1402)-N(4))-methyltransferase RsmH [Deltaproteobacteria bacterium]|nr:16S rRNA (cytosine(1402)-N(4))-methyltransferase RsmH [Deltaproteobacteria bacterium]
MGPGEGFFSPEEAGREFRRRGGAVSWEGLFGHAPVLLKECLEALAPRPDGLYVDATLGGGGYSRSILKRLGPSGRLLALDLDPEPLSWAGEWGGSDTRLILRRSNFSRLSAILEDLSSGPADGVVADLGPSSRQFLQARRGFSFRADGPLDMRLDPDSPVTARDLVNGLEREALERIIRRGGDHRAARLARLICRKRGEKPIETTGELSTLALKAAGPKGRAERIHPATRLFLSLRMAVNGELSSLGDFLEGARGNLKTGGRLLVVSFHSEEDKLVKDFFKNPHGGFRALWKKGLEPSEDEVRANPRARSARLRGGEAI